MGMHPLEPKQLVRRVFPARRTQEVTLPIVTAGILSNEGTHPSLASSSMQGGSPFAHYRIYPSLMLERLAKRTH